MPRLSEGVYAQHYNSVVTMAKRKGGVSRPEIMKVLEVSRVMADALIERCKLRKSKKKIGRTEFFHASRGTKGVLAAVNTGDDAGKDKPATKTPEDQGSETKAKQAKPAQSSKPSSPDGPSAAIVSIRSEIKELLDAAAKSLAEYIDFRSQAEAAGDKLRKRLLAESN